MTTNSGANGDKGGKWWSSLGKWAPYIVAFLVLGTFVYFAVRMMGLTEAEEMEWARYVYVFGGIEAIAFAAAGFLFGKEVHRAQAESAEKRADNAEGKAKESETEAVKGRELATFIKARAEAMRTQAAKAAEIGIRGTKPSTELGSVQAELDEISSVAKKLFP